MRTEVWEDEKINAGEHERNGVFQQLFRALPNYQEYFYKSKETQRKRFLLLFENTVRKRKEITCLIELSKCKFSLLMPSLPQQLVLVLCS